MEKQLDQLQTGQDFIGTYVSYADVIEAPAVMHEAVALSVVGAILNKNGVHGLWGGIKIPLDLWLLLLSRSGFGRNTSVDFIRPVLIGAGIDGLFQNANWGSSQGFYQSVAKQPYGLLVWPEFAYALKLLSEKGGVKEWITDRYDSFVVPDPKVYVKRNKASDTEPIVFERPPRLNILATSSHDWFMRNLVEEDTTGGFIPRWLLLGSEGRGKVLPKPGTPDAALVPWLESRLTEINKLDGTADLSAVEASYEKWYRQAHDRFSSSPFVGLAMPFFSRLRAQVVKMAIVYEVSQTASLTVSEQAMARAVEMGNKVIDTLFSLFKTGFTYEGSQVSKMLEAIRASGVAGLFKSEFTSTFSSVRGLERESRLKTLIDSRDVYVYQRSGGGRPALVLVAADFTEKHKEQYPEDVLLGA